MDSAGRPYKYQGANISGVTPSQCQSYCEQKYVSFSEYEYPWCANPFVLLLILTQCSHYQNNFHSLFPNLVGFQHKTVPFPYTCACIFSGSLPNPLAVYNPSARFTNGAAAYNGKGPIVSSNNNFGMDHECYKFTSTMVSKAWMSLNVLIHATATDSHKLYSIFILIDKYSIADFTKVGARGRCLDSNGNLFAEAWGPERPWIDWNEAERYCPVYCGQ